MEDSPESIDSEFEVTAEMLIHDTLDDETTLAQDEALQTKEEDEEELTGLQEEGNMPLEQLLSLYGCSGSSQLPGASASSLEPRSNVAQMDSSNTGIRSRRRRSKITQTGEADTTDSASGPISPSQRRRLASGRKEELEPSAGSKSSLSEGAAARGDHVIPDGSRVKRSGTSLLEHLSQTASENAALVSLEQLASQQGLPNSNRMRGVVSDDRGRQSDQDTEDNTDIEVVEDDGMGVGLEAGLGEVDHGLLRLAQMERDVVQMGDIEAGLGKGEGLFPPLDLICKESLVGGASGMDHAAREWADPMVVEEASMASGHWVEERQEENDIEEGMGGGRVEEEVVEEEEEEEESSMDEAVYGDVMLSTTGNVPAVYTVEELQPVSENPSPASAGKGFVRGSRLRPEMPERRSMRLMSNDDRALLSTYFASVLSDASGSDSDEEYPPQEDWKKEVKVGAEYQAIVPDYAPTTPYPSAAKALDRMVWTPSGTTDRDVSAYLGALSSLVGDVSMDCTRDHEKGLEVFASCNHNAQKALKIMQSKRKQSGMSPWTEEECRAFEEGLRSIGKDFFLLHRKVPSRSVKELVEFYYLWKKSQRYDHFIQKYGKIGRRKIIVSPGHVSDFMDKYLDMHSSDAVDIHYLTTTVTAEAKKENY